MREFGKKQGVEEAGRFGDAEIHAGSGAAVEVGEEVFVL
jgi:hypothetical protein